MYEQSINDIFLKILTFSPLLCAGETVELLDIGLRHLKDHNAVHRVKSSASTHRFSITSPSKTLYGSGASKSTMTLMHYIRDSVETINLQGSQDSSGELSPAPPQRPTSLVNRSEITSVGSNSLVEASPDRSRAMASVPLAIKQISILERDRDRRAVSIGSPRDLAASGFLPPQHLPSKVPPPSLATKSRTSVKEGDETDQGGNDGKQAVCCEIGWTSPQKGNRIIKPSIKTQTKPEKLS